MANLTYSAYYSTGAIAWHKPDSKGQIYVGKGKYGGTKYTYRSKIEFKVSEETITSSGKLVIKIKVQDYNNQTYGNLRARLTTSSLAYNNIYDSSVWGPSDSLANATILKTSVTTDQDGKNLVGTTTKNPNDILYIVFDTANNIKPNQTYYIYLLREDTSSERFNAFSIESIDLDYTTYTSCGAPTSVSASGIIAPNGTFTVSWSGAKGGTSNSIVGYDIYYLISASGTVPSTSNYTGKVSVDSSSTSGSKSISVSKATRGYKIACGVVTRGSAGADLYSTIKTGGSITINTLPDAPTISGSNGTVSSTASISVSASAGSDKDEQTPTVYYNTTNNSSTASPYKEPLTGPGKGKSITYYFWTYDGLEFSSVVSRTVTRNSEPTVGIGVSGTQVTSINNNSGYPYIISPTITATKGANGQNSNNKYTFKIYYGTSSSSLSSIKTFNAQTGLTLSITDIRTYIGTKKYYQIGVIRNDGLEYSSETRSDIYYITPIPEVTVVSNKKNEPDGIEPQAYFSKEIYIEADRDDGYTHIKFNGIYSKFTNSGNKMYTTCDVTSLNHGQSYKFVFTLYNSNYIPTTTQTWNTSLTKILDFGDDLNLVWNDTVNPFTAEEQNLTFRNIFGTTDLNETVYNKYGFLEAPTYKLTAKYGGKSQFLNFTQTSNTPDKASISLLGKQIYNLFDSLFPGEDKNKNTTYNTEVVLSIVNVFGDAVQGTKSKKVKYYGETPILTLSSLEFWNGNNNAQLKTEYFKQSMVPKISLECKSYYGQPSEIILKGINGDDIFYSESIIIDEQIIGVGALGNNSPMTYKISNLIFPSIGVQSEDLIESSTTFTCSVVLSNSLADEVSKEFTGSRVGKHTEGKIVIDEANYEPGPDNESLSLIYSIKDFGLSINDNSIITNKWYTNQLQYKIPGSENWINNVYFDNNGISYSNKTENRDFRDKPNENPFEVNFSTEIFKKSGSEQYDYITIRLYLTVRSQCNTVNNNSGYGQTNKYAYSNEFVVYNLKPTVAYRKNKLGINYDFVNKENKEDGVLMVSEYNNLNKIYLLHTEGSRNINIKNGKLSGFVFNGGVWGEDLGDDEIGVITGSLPAAESVYF